MKWLCVAMAAVAALACGGSAHEDLTAAREALADTDYAAAAQAAQAGLAKGPDEITEWGLALARLEALARGGDGETAHAYLDSLAERWPDRVPVTQYAATADQLRAAGSKPEAIRVLDAGLQRFPDDAMLVRLIGADDSEGMESAELDMLRSLGYVE